MKQQIQTIIPFYLMVIFTTIVLNFNVQAQLITPLLTASPHDISTDLFGLNGTNTITQGQSWKELNALPTGNPFCMMNVGHLRYPGGSVTNFWDWKKGWFFSQYQLPTGIIKPDNFPDNLPAGMDNRLEEFKKSLDLSNAKPLFVLNPMTDNLPNQIAMLYHALSIGIPVENIEIGGEYYLDDYYFKIAFPSPQSYVQVVNDWAKAIKLNDAFVNIKIGIMGATSTNNDAGRRKQWLDCIVSEMAKLNGTGIGNNKIDAIILHDYRGAQSGTFTPPGPVMVKENVNIMINSAFTNVKNTQATEMALINSLSPRPEIWITEFNLFDRNAYSMHATWAHGLFVASMALKYLETNNVQKVTLHTMLGNGVWSFFFADNGGLTKWPGFTEPTNNNCGNSQAHQLTAAGNAFQMICTAAKEANSITTIDFTADATAITVPSNNGEPSLYGTVFTNTVTGQKRAVILNVNANDVDFPELNLTTIAGGAAINNVTSLYSNDPEFAVDGNAPACSLQVDNAQWSAGSFIIKPGPYSITLIDMSPTVCELYCPNTAICFGDVTSLRCNGGSFDINNDVTVTLNGGTPLAGLLTVPFNCEDEIHFNSSAINPTSFPITATVAVVLHDPNGAPLCTVTKDITIKNRPLVTVTNNVTGNCIKTGSLTANVSNNATPVSYCWTPAGALSSSNTPTVAVTNLTQDANYVAYVYDGVCAAKSAEIAVDLPLPVIEIPETKGFCVSANTATLSFIPHQCNAAVTYHYSWNTTPVTTGNFTNADEGNLVTSVFTLPANSGSYIYTVTITVLSGSTCSASYNESVNAYLCCTSSGVTMMPYNNTTDLITSLTNAGGFTIVGNNPNPISVTRTSNAIIYINGDLTTKNNDDIVFQNCSFKMGEHARIVLQGKNSKLRFEGCTFDYCSSGKLWDGIVANGSDKKVEFAVYNTTQRCSISHATVGVNLSGQAGFIITGTNFLNNTIGLSFSHYEDIARPVYTTPTSGIPLNFLIYDNIFSNNGNFSNPSTMPIGIYLLEVPGVTIGDETQNTNQFTSLNIGIYAIRAAINIYHNTFSDMPYLKLKATGIAIYITSSSDCAGRQINIGNTIGNNSNSFVRCGTGIYGSGDAAYKIIGNTFGTAYAAIDKITENDILINAPGYNTVNISYNTINEFNKGIAVYNLTKEATELRIWNNVIANLAIIMQASNAFEGTGILIDNNITTKAKISSVFNNTITNPRIGIFARNAQQIQIGDAGNGNSVTTNVPAMLSLPAPHSGIFVQNCTKARLVDNIITNNYVASSTAGIIGIDLQTSTNARVNCNTINRYNSSMEITGDCSGTLLRHNTMGGYVQAINLNSATLPNQYQINDVITTDKEPTDNIWNDPPKASGSPTNRVTGSSNGGQIEWYYQNTGGVFNPLDNNTTSPILTAVSDAAGTVICNDYSNKQSRDDQFGDAVGDSLHFDDNADENIYLAKMNTFKTFKEDTTILSQGNGNDASYQQFYDDVALSNMGALVAVGTLANDSNTIVAAQNINAAINDTNSIEYFKKTINDIYLNTIAIGLDLSATDSSFLNYCTTLTIYQAGDAIYMAAAMLGLEIHPTAIAMRHATVSEQANAKAVKNELSIFPNPAKDSFTINGTDDDIKTILLYDDKGALVKSFTITANNVYKLNVPTGFYQLKIENTDGILYQFKITVIK